MYMIANRLCMVDGVQNRLHVGTRAKTLSAACTIHVLCLLRCAIL